MYLQPVFRRLSKYRVVVVRALLEDQAPDVKPVSRSRREEPAEYGHDLALEEI